MQTKPQYKTSTHCPESWDDNEEEEEDGNYNEEEEKEEKNIKW